MSLGYNVDLTMAVFPAFFVGIILIYSKRFRYIGDFLFGIAFLFFALVLLSAAGTDLDLQHNPDAINFFSSFDTNSRWTIILFLFIGTLITCLVQSSAAVMAITILLCSTGVLPIYLGIALVMGENIGTTATANLAALGANTQARRAALAHLFFNVIGVTWVMCLFYPFVDMVCSVVGYNPADTTISVAQRAAILPIVLAAFHTAFNVTNTSLLIGFIPQLERLVCFVLPTKEDSDEEDFRLRFIQAGIMKTPELSVFEAQKEISSFGERIQRMFGMVQDLLHEQNPEKSAKLVERIKKYEVISDSMEIEIAKYLDHVGNAHLSDDTKMKIRNMLREISEIESIGDSCYNLARTISHGRESNERLTPELRQNVEQMFKLTDEALTQMNYTFQHNREKVDVNKSFEIENNINDLRERLRDQNIDDVNDHKYSYDLGTAYLDIIQECEKLGDYVINVVQARMNLRRQ